MEKPKKGPQKNRKGPQKLGACRMFEGEASPKGPH